MVTVNRHWIDLGARQQRPKRNTKPLPWGLVPTSRAHLQGRLHTGQHVPSDLPSGEYPTLTSEKSTLRRRNPTGPREPPTPLYGKSLEYPPPTQRPRTFPTRPGIPTVPPYRKWYFAEDSITKFGERASRVGRHPQETPFFEGRITIPKPAKTRQVARGASNQGRRAGLTHAKKLAARTQSG